MASEIGLTSKADRYVLQKSTMNITIRNLLDGDSEFFIEVGEQKRTAVSEHLTPEFEITD
jgi:hypothetical protein